MFLSVALGYLLGRVPIGGVRIGGICGTVIVALILGQASVQIAPGASGLSFLLFIYSLGYLGGPAFLSGLSRRTLGLMVFPVLQFVFAVGLTLLAARVLGLSVSTAVGLLTGASAQSAALGTASGLLPAADIPALTTSFAVAYLVSILTTVILVSQVLPRILRIDRDNGDAAATPAAVPPDVIGRAYLVTSAPDLTVQQWQSRLGPQITIVDILPGAATPQPGMIAAGDTVRLIGARTILATAAQMIGPEVPMPPEFTISLQTVEVTVSRTGSHQITLPSIRNRSVVVLAVRRLDQALVVDDDPELRAGDVLTLAGTTAAVLEQAKQLGTIRSARVGTYFAFLGAGLAVGIGIGLGSVHLGAVPLSLGTSAAVLLTGLLIGWLNSRRQTFGQYDPAAANVVKDLGLTIFIGCTALTAAPGALQFFRHYGIVVPALSVIAVIGAAFCSLLISYKVLHLPALQILGVLAGQQSSSPTMSALQQRFESSEPMLSYVPIYATSTILGPILMPAVIPLITLITS